MAVSTHEKTVGAPPAQPVDIGELAITESDAKPFSFARRVWMNSTCLLLGDFVALGISILLGGYLRLFFAEQTVIPAWIWLILPVWTLGTALTGLLPSWGLGPVDQLRRITTLILSSFALVSVALFLSKTGGAASRFTLTSAFMISLILVPLIRIRVKGWLLQASSWGVPTVIYGSDQTTSHVLAALRAEPGLGYIPVGIFDDDSAPGSLINGVPVLGPMDQNCPDAPHAIIATTQTSRERLIHLLEGPLTIYRRVIMIPDLLDAPSLWVTPRDFVGLIGLEIAVNLLNPFARFIKRATDVTLVTLSAPLWIPLCGVLGLCIWLEDRRNPMFIQERIGLFGEKFNTWKFRTMHPNAEELLQKKIDNDPELKAEWVKGCKLRNDPRVTRVGALLRRTSMDELPQFLNIFLGDMSLVGPRPLPEYHYKQLPSQLRALRDRVRPGLTGLWQVSGRSESGTKGMERWDAYYVRNWSFWLDVVILVRTIRVVLTGRGAY